MRTIDFRAEKIPSGMLRSYNRKCERFEGKSFLFSSSIKSVIFIRVFLSLVHELSQRYATIKKYSTMRKVYVVEQYNSVTCNTFSLDFANNDDTLDNVQKLTHHLEKLPQLLIAMETGSDDTQGISDLMTSSNDVMCVMTFSGWFIRS